VHGGSRTALFVFNKFTLEAQITSAYVTRNLTKLFQRHLESCTLLANKETLKDSLEYSDAVNNPQNYQSLNGV
jgi:hypothetical protein